MSFKRGESEGQVIVLFSFTWYACELSGSGRCTSCSCLYSCYATGCSFSFLTFSLTHFIYISIYLSSSFSLLSIYMFFITISIIFFYSPVSLSLHVLFCIYLFFRIFIIIAIVTIILDAYFLQRGFT